MLKHLVVDQGDEDGTSSMRSTLRLPVIIVAITIGRLFTFGSLMLQAVFGLTWFCASDHVFMYDER
ncbi:hypothetical protein KT99_05622 [Shewanella benthica KT99]|uniref:Uncharacterized protein n=1 Tax=Shewanella benthica KT99 TaxID=314608 RepID=A9DFK7_9GAMM|nr:hypothetical protein KT99_05622 [Shewanella benthica KT99]